MFPRVKAYIEEQKEMLYEKGYITTVFGDPINISYDSSKPSEKAEAERFAGNYPTQSSASSVAALVGEQFNQKAKKEGWDFHLGGFIHDCEEGCFNTNLLLEVFDEYPKLAETYPYETYGLPMSIDIEIGVCGGPGLVEFKRLKGKTKFVENDVLEAKFEGISEYTDKLFERLSKNYHVELIDVEEEDSYQSWSEMYLKVASSFRLSLGQTVKMKHGKIRVSKL